MINSFGVIVRPNVAPDIRPPAVKIKIETDDDADVEIIGQRGQCIDLEHSQRVSATFTEKRAEQFRLFDRVRVANPNRIPASALNTPHGVTPVGLRQYVDIEITHYIQYLDEFGHLIIDKYRKPDHLPSQGQFILEENIRRSVT